MKRKSNCLATILFLIYLALLIWIILFKLQFSISDLDKVRSINLIPFHYDKEVGAAFHLTEVLENVLIFVPMGIYLQMLLPRTKLYVKFMLIAGTSFLLETMQYILAVGRSDITDVLTNTAGGLLGLAVYSIAARLIGNRIKANRLFSILAGIVSVVVIGLLGFFCLLIGRRCILMSKKEMTTEKRLKVRLYLSLLVYTVVGYGLTLILDYIFSKFDNGIFAWLYWRLGPLFILYLVIGFVCIFNYYWKKPWDYLDEVIDATQTVYEQNSHTVSLSDPLKELEEQLNQIKMSVLLSKQAAKQAEEKKNEIVMYLAHDIRTPLTTVIGYLSYSMKPLTCLNSKRKSM